ncbi:MAG: 4-hydroxy-tetrahydrodipicolinate synthase [Candidatus Dactylopiibacterium carminicum]|uniref:4-hydroxy-tetrahydrodipicolinate synthase n=1 Tax=Candidatus Dactylopiibacterium carminicum TaxID=857335 RepID=A0A272EMF0_9RHOO|nr:4-hydroxy-tetrahydrodipicolinate synthase [Candidatus Dactylopiibacterium carminicum]KAF7597700.1 4-hydroxy-tetrahydrodipicolinate synthase [Candidatus Dactylopiibacterium carminicum]PAS91309.1 MAG: 4-hydroxy-tetrahydrodipicolinate synthase [Candidatus Dactylopiibacterium carminicum]PAS92039.1 MAG: 4-hydroxy-tetrahydrodipicolinate synthase [Candidatus Dactylopiibacterium carminicum]PAS94352.1 MAG: 4-hydroxy-tetrahydrodipicolinate synthase [Candidatus Dactylopiibacterium carminicum]
MITGSLVALLTPMNADGKLDLVRFRTLIDFHVKEGSDGLVVVGTTGESPTVTVEEHCELIRTAVEHAAGRLPVIAGTGANSTREAIELARFAKQVGAQASLSVVPYYNKPTQEGLYGHFRSIAEAVDLPVILYNVPGRTVADLQNDTVLRLAKVPGIIGIKDATGNIERITDLAMRAPEGFALYSGDDMTAMAFMLLGGHGVISVSANVVPRLVHELCEAASRGDVAQANAINRKLFLLNRDLFVEANPIPAKWAAQQIGLMGGGIRLPLTQLSEGFHERVRLAMRAADIQF